MKNAHKYIVKLYDREYRQLQRITRSGKHNARVIKRAHILLKTHAQYIDKDIAEHVGVSKRTVERVRKNYIEGGLDRALYDAPRPGKPPIITPKVEAHLVAVACTPPPEGAVRWTLELLRERLIDDKVVTRILLNAIHEHLTNRGIKPWQEKMWCIPEIDTQFIERMEDIVDLYKKPYDPQEPVIGFDEKAKQLIEDKRLCIPMKPHKPQRYDYEYRRNGTRNIFLAVEPKAGFRTIFITKRRTKVDFAHEIERIVMLPRYQTARRTHIVLDNLNTHCEKSLIETLGEEKTRAIMSRVQFHHTPKHASWLNMAEIEISILSRQCLHLRIPTETILKHDIARWEQRRNSRQATIHWKFTKQDARKIFKYDNGQN